MLKSRPQNENSCYRLEDILMCITNKILITTYKEHLEIIRKAQITQ